MDEKNIGQYWRLIILVVCLLGALLSVTVVGTRLNDPDSYGAITESLNEKKMNVEKLAGSATAASAAITLMPGDFGTPIAEKLADLSGYFLLILIAIYIEKFLVSVTGLIVFDFMLPIGLVLLGIGQYVRVPLKKAALKMISLGVILALLVPTSVAVSELVEKQYNAEIQQTIDEANQNAESIQGVADEADNDNTSIWSEFITTVKGGSATILDKMQSILNNFVDVIAIYIVTSCVIPVAVLMLGLWIIKTMFQLSTPMPVAIKGGSLAHGLRGKHL